MKPYVILTDSACDMDKDLREKYGIEYLSMRTIYQEKDVPSNLDWIYFTPKEFYNMMRDGVRFSSSQVNPSDYLEAFKRFSAEGYDILYLGCSSALSASFKGSLIAKEEFVGISPETTVICIDTRRASIGLGILCITASRLRSEGKTIEETAAYIEAHKQELHQVGTVADLTYLRRAGRVSVSSAIFGNLLQVKPIIIADVNGKNAVIGKVKGRKNSLTRVVEYFVENYLTHPYQTIAIAQADCLDEAVALKEEILKVLPDPNVEILTAHIGTAIGASVGPGMIGLYFYGKTVTHEA